MEVNLTHEDDLRVHLVVFGYGVGPFLAFVDAEVDSAGWPNLPSLKIWVVVADAIKRHQFLRVFFNLHICFLVLLQSAGTTALIESAVVSTYRF